MKTVFKAIFLAVLLTISASAALFAQKSSPSANSRQTIKFEHLTVEDGLSQSSVFAIVQDRRGLMWFGTWDGLNKYDGYRFTIYKYNPQNPYSLSNNEVRALCEDSQGVLWVGTMDGLCRFDREKERFIRYRHDPDNPDSLAGNKVRAVAEDNNGILWVGTEDGGLSRFDRHTGQFFHYRHHPGNSESLSHNDVRALHFDSQGMLWVGTWGGGLNRFDPNTEHFVRYQHVPREPASFSDNFVRTVYEDQQGTVWVGTENGGLSRFHREAQRFTNYLPESDNPYSLSDKEVISVCETRAGELWIGTRGGGLNKFDRNKQRFLHYLPPNGNNVWSLYEDRSGILWVGTTEGGVNKALPNLKNFIHYRNDPDDPASLSGNDVWSIFEDGDGVLWVGVWDHGLNRFDRQTGTFTHYMPDPENPHSLSQQDVDEIIEDHEGILWIGTAEGGLNKFDRRTGRFTHYTHDPDDPQSLASNNVFTIYEDRQHILWTGSYFGKSVSRFDRNTETFGNFSHEPGNPHSLGVYGVWSLFEDSHGAFWVLTNGGGLSQFDRRTERFAYHTHDPANSQSVSHNNVTVIHEDHTGNLWIGTWGGGLNKFDRETGTFAAYREEDGLPSNSVMGILEDEQGHLWLSTIRGISQFDPEQETFKNYIPKDGLQSLEFNATVAFKGRDGQMFFGGINGFNAFHPREIRDNPHIPPIVLTDFQIFNKSVPVGDDSILRKSVTESDEITLSYKESVFTFEFAALNYQFPEKNHYKYKLEGFEEEWRADGTRRFATYTNLDAGEYVFRVIGSNNDGVWNKEGASIKITITPPWWETIWFRASMLILVIGLIFSGFRWRVRAIKSQKRRLEILVDEKTRDLGEAKEAAEAANRAKSTFLANMSHELRTPLNGILGYAHILRSDPATPEKQQHGLDVIEQGGNHLLNLINDVLDLAKVESGKIDLYETDFSMPSLIRGVSEIIRIRAEGKGIAFRSEHPDNLPAVVHGDERRLRQILLNLLGNAVKFTVEGSVTLKVALRQAQGAGLRQVRGAALRQAQGSGAVVEPAPVVEPVETFRFSIEDTGVGISPEDLNTVFDPFRQVGDRRHQAKGTGLGLAVSRNLAELMGGTLHVESQVGSGSTFRLDIMLPVVQHDTENGTVSERRIVGIQGEPRTVLVVDDNRETGRC
ncbi:MAG: histidine kinase [Proteobacteria bacterium]|nr:histidine kinase [Pseudomonadota bacterium]